MTIDTRNPALTIAPYAKTERARPLYARPGLDRKMTLAGSSRNERTLAIRFVGHVLETPWGSAASPLFHRLCDVELLFGHRFCSRGPVLISRKLDPQQGKTARPCDVCA